MNRIIPNFVKRQLFNGSVQVTMTFAFDTSRVCLLNEQEKVNKQVWCCQCKDCDDDPQFNKLFTIYIDTGSENWRGKDDIDVHL